MLGHSPYGHRPPHPCNSGMEYTSFSPTRQAFVASSAKRCGLFGESHEEGAAGEARSGGGGRLLVWNRTPTCKQTAWNRYSPFQLLVKLRHA